MLNNMELHSIFINISRKIFVDSLINIALFILQRRINLQTNSTKKWNVFFTQNNCFLSHLSDKYSISAFVDQKKGKIPFK